MLYRIDYETFLTHAIDHFTREDLLSMQYAVVSASIRNGGRITNVVKINNIYPSPETQENWISTKDIDIIRKSYFDELDELEKSDLTIYRIFINMIIKHQNIMIICSKDENQYIDLLVEYLKKKYPIDCIDLNKLFKEGSVGDFYLDFNELYNSTVKTRRNLGHKIIANSERTKSGREHLLSIMSKRDKIEKLKELGIKINKSEEKDIDEILIESWVEEVGD